MIRRKHWRDAERGLLTLFIGLDEPVARRVCRLVSEARDEDYRAFVAVMNELSEHMPASAMTLLRRVRDIAATAGYPWHDTDDLPDVLREAGKSPEHRAYDIVDGEMREKPVSDELVAQMFVDLTARVTQKSAHTANDVAIERPAVPDIRRSTARRSPIPIERAHRRQTKKAAPKRKAARGKKRR